MLKVRLLSLTECPEETIAFAAGICYASRPNPKDIIPKLIESGHLSPLEHASFTFLIEGISRACSHQLVRHRIASFSQESQRYVDSVGDIVDFYDFVDTEDVKVGFPNPENIMMKASRAAIASYRELLALGVKAEDARYVLPQSVTTRLVMTMNARELLHFFNLRCCNRAQREIREVANEVLGIVKKEAPNVFRNAGAPCEVDGKCPELKPCGRVI